MMMIAVEEGCSGGICDNNNGCRNDGGKGDGDSEGCEDQLQRRQQQPLVLVLAPCCHEKYDGR
jgi:hypothetical protein